MICHIDIVKLSFLLEVLTFFNVLGVVLGHLSIITYRWVGTIFINMHLLNIFKSNSVIPLSKEFSHFLWFVVMWLRKLDTPEWCVAPEVFWSTWFKVIIVDKILIVDSLLESPDMILIKTMIDQDE